MVGDERSALQAVVAADVELMELREEEEQLSKQLQDTSLQDEPKGFDADEASERLNEVYCWLTAQALFAFPLPCCTPCDLASLSVFTLYLNVMFGTAWAEALCVHTPSIACNPCCLSTPRCVAVDAVVSAEGKTRSRHSIM